MATAAVPRPLRRPPLLAVGTVVWLASELLFFAGLFAAYYALRANASTWPPAGVELDVTPIAIATVVLVSSSGTMQLAVRAVKRDDRKGFLRWLAATFVLGAIFVTAQARDYTRLNFKISSHAYGSAFYTTTGFHGLHVIAGLLAMLVVAGRATNTSFGERNAGSVEMLSYYWHFVDVVWIGLFATIYLVR